MLDVTFILAQAFWLIAPAYAANAFPPLIKGRIPIDLKMNLRKHRILGDGKTIEGSVAGIIFGMLIGSAQILSQTYIPKEFGLATMTLPLAFLLSFGTIFGDIAGSFIKRRFGIPRGNSFILIDQLDFLIFALLFASFATAIGFYVILVLIVLTPPIHWIANVIGYSIKVKKTPW
ncbi:MAG: CDP-2,3-bis-(O-geranylgeranyl)-sn-glycerol synthase [Candidatus Aenigmatarchaeota archaeon]